MVIEAGELARKKSLGIAAGTQRRHQKSYIETIKRIKDGAIGDILYAKAYWNGGQIWVVDRESHLERRRVADPQLELLHLARRRPHRRAARAQPRRDELGPRHPPCPRSLWPGRPPGDGRATGRAISTITSPSSIEYPGGITVFSQCRQISGCENIVGEAVIGTKGTSNCADRIETKGGSGRWRYRGASTSPYQQEHQDLIASILAGNPINEARTDCRIDPDRHHRPRGRLQRPGHHLGRGHQVEDQARARRIQVWSLPDAAGGHARAVQVHLSRNGARNRLVGQDSRILDR